MRARLDETTGPFWSGRSRQDLHKSIEHTQLGVDLHSARGERCQLDAAWSFSPKGRQPQIGRETQRALGEDCLHEVLRQS
jgi:hypothetical protein